MAIGPEEIHFILETFGISANVLARALNVKRDTIARWENEQSRPTGLQYEVMAALYLAAMQTGELPDTKRKRVIAGRLTLGVGAIVLGGLMREDDYGNQRGLERTERPTRKDGAALHSHGLETSRGKRSKS